MIEKLLLDNWKALLIGALVALCYFFFSCWQHEKVGFEVFKAKTEQAGKAAEEESQRLDKEHQDNLVAIRKDHEDQVPAIRADAVANYLANRIVRQQPGGSKVPGAGPGIRVDDRKIAQCLPDEQFIQDAAEDSAKLAAWQQYGELNHIPVIDEAAK